jgi:TRAP-type C4-dicarboxylate transport system substrate-binding protein
MDCLPKFAARVGELSGGRLKIDCLPGGSIVPVDETLVALGKGVFEVTTSSGGYWEGDIPVGSIEEGLPFLYRGFGKLDELDAIMASGLTDLYREVYAEWDVHYIGHFSYHAYPCIMSKLPIRSLDDWKGVKIRAYGPWMDFLGRLGANPTWMPGAELYMAMKLGTIDVATYDCFGPIGFKLFEVMDYLILPPFADHAISNMLVNADAWDALPADLKQVFNEAYKEYAVETYFGYDEYWTSDINQAAALGYEVITLPDADVETMKEIAAVQWADYAVKDDYCARAVRIAKDFYGIA